MKFNFTFMLISFIALETVDLGNIFRFASLLELRMYLTTFRKLSLALTLVVINYVLAKLFTNTFSEKKGIESRMVS